MKCKIWLFISGALLISTHLQADDSDYGNRQFNINPNNMMGGMFNPMRNFFGGSNRYSDDYYNYRYAPPPAYQPGYGYGYHPAAPYGYPPVNPGYQPQTGGYPSNIPPQQAPAAAVRAQPPQAPAPSSYAPTVSGQPTGTEQFRFRPLDASEQPFAPLDYPAKRKPSAQATGTEGMQTMELNNAPSMQQPPGSQASQLKFRPLDKPGYSE